MKLLNGCRRLSVLTASVLFAVSAGVYLSRQNDQAQLKTLVETEIAAVPSKNSPFFAALNHWIYLNKGFKKNHGYFWLPQLGPTPIQVLQEGGDCADKSRLLMAMLDSVGIDSTLIMLYDANGNPTHTVVEIRDGRQLAVADPVYDLTFPKPQGGYYSLSEMRGDPDILTHRLDALVAVNGRENKIAHYKRDIENYRFATTINWDKNRLLKMIAGYLQNRGIEPQTLRRPHLLDDPKLMIACLSFAGGMGFSFLAFFFRLCRPGAGLKQTA